MNAGSKLIQTPIGLTIAGSDSGGGAGIQADLKAMSALGVYGASVITAVTAQNTRAVTDVHEVPTSTIRAQISAVLDDLPVAAIKIGMLSSVDIIEAVVEKLAHVDIPIVSDPVMVAKSGDRLLRRDALDVLRDKLLPLATVLTPNVPEAADLLGAGEASTDEAMIEQGRQLVGMGADFVLMKGGHRSGPGCTDFLIGRDGSITSLSTDRIETANTHGTGCTLSAAIAAGLAKGLATGEAVRTAHAYLNAAIIAADRLKIGSGHGPVNHFYGIWQ